MNDRFSESRRNRDVPAERPTAQGDLDSARALRDTLAVLGGRPTRELKTIAPDAVNPEYESADMFAAALGEYSFWASELSLWKRFVRWRKWVSNGRPDDALLWMQEALPPDPPVDAYPLHLEFRAYLLEQIEEMAKFPPPPWEEERVRLDTLEEQLAETRAERGLPSDDNPPPPALLAIRAAEAARDAAGLARIQKVGPRHLIRPPSPESLPPPPRRGKRKRERGGEDRDRNKITGAAVGGTASEAVGETAGDVEGRGPGAVQLDNRPPAKRRATRRAAAAATTTVAEKPPPRRSMRIAALPLKNYKV